jgi:hypothetical protein
MLSYLPERISVEVEQLTGWTVRSDGDDLRLNGPCPVCAQVFDIAVPLSTTALESVAKPKSLTVSLPCCCTEEHAGRPEGVETGCGRKWSVQLTATGAGYDLRPAVDPNLIEAADALRGATGDQLATLRAAAEKWIAGIAALYGIFGLAGVTLAKDSVAALSTVGRAGVAVAALAAVAAAATAIVAGYRAAYGWPVVHLVRDDDELRNWYAERRRAPAVAAARLRRAVRLGGASVAALTVAVGLIWFLPPRAPATTPVRITRTDESQLCGQILATSATSTVRMRRADDGSVEAVPVTDIRRMTPVKAC